MSSPTPPKFNSAEDLLSRKQFADRLERFLMVEHDYVDGGLVVALNAGFGSGKTTFLQMWKADLKERRKAGNFDPMPVLLNAWENDFCGDPLLSVMTALIDALKKWHPDDDTDANQLIEAVKDISWFSLGLLNGFTSKVGFDAFKSAEIADKKKQARKQDKQTEPDFIEAYRERTKAFEDLKKTLKAVFGGKEPKVIICVDELDRCRPDFAVDYIETIKHIFDIEGLVFVLAVDEEHLANSARSLFGQDLVFPEYFRKFCHRSINLPEPDDNAWNKLSSTYMQHYLNVEGKRWSALSQDSHRVQQITEMIRCLNLKPRQIQDAFRVMGHALSCTEEYQGRIKWCIGVATIFLSALRTTEPELYRQIGSLTISNDQVAEFLINKLGKDKAAWWFKVYATGLESFTPYEFNQVFSKFGFVDGSQASPPAHQLGQFHQGWDESRLQGVYQTIEEIGQFIDN